MWKLVAGAQLANFVGGGEAPPSWGGGRKFFGKISVKLCILEHFKPLLHLLSLEIYL